MSCVLCVVCCVCVRTWDSSADEQRTNECAGPRQRREGREETRRRGDECAWTRTVTETTTETNAMERTRRKETKEETKQRNVCENGKEDVCARSGGDVMEQLSFIFPFHPFYPLYSPFHSAPLLDMHCPSSPISAFPFHTDQRLNVALTPLRPLPIPLSTQPLWVFSDPFSCYTLSHSFLLSCRFRLSFALQRAVQLCSAQRWPRPCSALSAALPSAAHNSKRSTTGFEHTLTHSILSNTPHRYETSTPHHIYWWSLTGMLQLLAQGDTVPCQPRIGLLSAPSPASGQRGTTTFPHATQHSRDNTQTRPQGNTTTLLSVSTRPSSSPSLRYLFPLLSSSDLPPRASRTQKLKSAHCGTYHTTKTVKSTPSATGGKRVSLLLSPHTATSVSLGQLCPLSASAPSLTDRSDRPSFWPPTLQLPASAAARTRSFMSSVGL